MSEKYKQTFWKRIEEQEQKQKTCVHKVWFLVSGVTVYDTPQYFGFWESIEKCENCGAVRWVGENMYKHRVENER